MTAVAPCPPVSAVTRGKLSAPTALVGDVDGDGRPDKVTIRFAPALWTDCGILVVVRTRHGRVAARIRYGSEAGKFPRTNQFIRLRAAASR